MTSPRVSQAEMFIILYRSVMSCSSTKRLFEKTGKALIRGLNRSPLFSLIWACTVCIGSPGQQIRSKIDSYQNANFLISQPNHMMLPLIGIVSERRFQ